MKFLAIVAGLVSLSAAAPSPQVPNRGKNVTPFVYSQYYVSTGDIVYDTDRTLVRKTGVDSDITTLLTVYFPPAAAGKTGTFHFALDDSAFVTGSGQIDIFTSLNPATSSTLSWPPGSQRNTQVGRIQVVVDDTATWIFGSATFTIPEAGTYGYELVGVNDADLVSFSGSNNGIWIHY
jgi:hypothetical protein